VLPDGFPPTTVWGYGVPGVPASFRAPACTIEAQVDRLVRITWINHFVDARGRYLPHLFTVDPTAGTCTTATSSTTKTMR
jgi:spore coat protein A